MRSKATFDPDAPGLKALEWDGADLSTVRDRRLGWLCLTCVCFDLSAADSHAHHEL